MDRIKSWKLFEMHYSSVDEYRNDILVFLKKYNLFPEQTRFLMDRYSDEIQEWYEEGKYSRDFAEKIAKDLNLGSGGIMQYKMAGGSQWQNIYYR